MFYAVSVLFLGYTRLQGVTALNSETKEFLEITPALARRLIEQKQLKGLLWKNGEDGTEFYCDTEGWNQTNIPVKTACGKFRPLLNDYVGAPINSMYTVVRKLITDYRGTLYEVISNKCARVKITEENLRELSKITNVAGVFITEDEVKICDGVIVEDRMAKSKEETVDVTIDTMEAVEEPVIEEKEPESMDELFNSEVKEPEEKEEPEESKEPEEKEDNPEETVAKKEPNTGKSENTNHKNNRHSKKSSKQTVK